MGIMIPIKENHMQKKTSNEMETGLIESCRGMRFPKLGVPCWEPR